MVAAYPVSGKLSQCRRFALKATIRSSPLRVAVIGGGIIGCLSAWRLKLMGAEPVVLERGALGSESSWAGAGILSPIHPWLYPEAFSNLVIASLDLYPDFVRELEAEAEISVELHRSGMMIPLFDMDKVSHKPAALAWSERFGWQLEQLSGDQARSREPSLSHDVNGAMYWPEVGQVRNPRMLQAARLALQKLEVEVREHVEVTGLLEEGGKVAGVRLAQGEEFFSDAVLLAAGSWSGGLSAAMGYPLPVRPVKGQIVLLKCAPGTVRHIVKHDDAYFVPRLDGRVLVGASLEDAGFQRGNTVTEVCKLLDAVRRIMPTLGSAEIERQWMGFRPGSPDGLPYIGPVADKPGLWVATGHYRNGVVLAPVTADLISRWILGESPSLPMAYFDPCRNIRNQPKIGYP